MSAAGLAWDDRFGRLPKWAQAKVEALLRSTEAAERKAEALREETSPDTAPAVLCDYVTGDIGLPLTQYRRIQFYPFGRDESGREKHFTVTPSRNGIEVRAGWDVEIGVKPHVTNVIEIVDLSRR